MASKQRFPISTDVENNIERGRLLVLPGKLAANPKSVIIDKGVTRRPALGEIKNKLNVREVPAFKKPVSAVPRVAIKKTTNVTTQKDHKKVTSEIKVEGQKVVTLKREESIVRQAVTTKQVSSSTNESIEPNAYSTQHFGLIDENESDPQLVAEYINDIIVYLRELERKYAIKEAFLLTHKTTPRMRTVLINWLVEVHLNFRMLPETLYLCVSIVDRYLQENKLVGRENLQLVGITALFIAGKYEEMYIPELADFIYVCDDLFSRQKIMQMELSIMKALDFSYGRPHSLHFLRRFSKVGKAESIHHVLAKYVLELALMECEMSDIPPSLQAAAASCLSMSVLNNVTDPILVWSKTMVHYTEYKYSDIKSTIRHLAVCIVKAETSKHQAIRKKYTASRFGKISLRAELKCSLIKKLAQID